MQSAAKQLISPHIVTYAQNNLLHVHVRGKRSSKWIDTRQIQEPQGEPKLHLKVKLRLRLRDLRVSNITEMFSSCSFLSQLRRKCIDECHLTSWDLEVWATNPPPWKWMMMQGDEGSRLVFSPSDKEIAPPSARQRDSSVSLSWRNRVQQWVNIITKIALRVYNITAMFSFVLLIIESRSLESFGVTSCSAEDWKQTFSRHRKSEHVRKQNDFILTESNYKWCKSFTQQIQAPISFMKLQRFTWMWWE